MELFKIGFVPVRLLDIMDISLVTYLFYKLYHWLKGTISLRILIAFIAIFLIWKFVDLLDLVLLRSILDQFIGVGAIALIILFAPEIRRFLLIIGRNTIVDRLLRPGGAVASNTETIHKILDSVAELQKGKIGALIILTLEDQLERIQETGNALDASVSQRLLYTIFQHESPMHDGAVVIANNKIAAAGCVLPLTNKQGLPPELGLRHRAGLGISEVSTALAIIVSEERGEVSVAIDGNLHRNLEVFSIEKMLFDYYKMSITSDESFG